MLPDTYLSAIKAVQLDRVPMVGRFTLCMAPSARYASIRPAITGLIEQLANNMAFPQLARAQAVDEHDAKSLQSLAEPPDRR